jgi:hypothetical protein
MININFDGKTIAIKNTVNELLIGEFEYICDILNDTKNINTIEKWGNIFLYLGIPQDVLDNLDAMDFIELIKEFNISDKNFTTIENEITLDGHIYYYNFDEVKMTVKEVTLIESYITKDSNKYIGDMMAILYKRNDVDKNITFDKAHIEHKAKLFRKNITADKSIPFLTYLTKKLSKDSEQLND